MSAIAPSRNRAKTALQPGGADEFVVLRGDSGQAGEIQADVVIEAVGSPDAITTGSVQAAIGASECMREAMAGAGFAPERIVLSGGGAPELEPHLPMPVTLNDNLVLDGLALIARAP